MADGPGYVFRKPPATYSSLIAHTPELFSVVLRLGHAEPIPERIFKHRFHAVELIFRFGDELHAFGLSSSRVLRGAGPDSPFHFNTRGCPVLVTASFAVTGRGI